MCSFFEGDPLTIHIFDLHGALIERRLGRNIDEGEFTLVGCTVAPGFEWEDMEIAGRAELQTRYPQHRGIIEKLTRV